LRLVAQAFSLRDTGFMRSPCLICDSTIVVHVISGTESAVVKIDFHQGHMSLGMASSPASGLGKYGFEKNFHNFKYEK
jgi:hypothetical protein